MLKKYTGASPAIANEQQFIDSFRDLVARNKFSKSQIIHLVNKLHRTYKDLDYDYIKCVLFPEQYDPQRVPQRFAEPTCLFTDRQTFYPGTSSTGNGYVSFLPQDTSFYCTYCPSTATSWTGGSISTGTPAIGVYGQNNIWIPTNFSHVRLVSASIRLQYVGPAQSEQGFLTGSHVFEQPIAGLCNDVIENGFFTVRGRCSEGVRLTWYPKEEDDYKLYDTNIILNGITDGLTQAGIQNSAFNPQLTMSQYVTANGGGFVAMGTDITATTYNIFAPAQYWGIGPNKIQGQCPTQLVISWFGCAVNSAWFRVDIERHFEGIPRSVVRDFVSVARAEPSTKSLEVIQALVDGNGLFSSTMLQASQIHNHLVQTLPDICQDILSSNGVSSLLTSDSLQADTKMGIDKSVGAESISIGPYDQGIRYMQQPTPNSIFD